MHSCKSWSTATCLTTLCVLPRTRTCTRHLPLTQWHTHCHQHHHNHGSGVATKHESCHLAALHVDNIATTFQPRPCTQISPDNTLPQVTLRQSSKRCHNQHQFCCVLYTNAWADIAATSCLCLTWRPSCKKDCPHTKHAVDR